MNRLQENTGCCAVRCAFFFKKLAVSDAHVVLVSSPCCFIWWPERISLQESRKTCFVGKNVCGTRQVSVSLLRFMVRVELFNGTS